MLFYVCRNLLFSYFLFIKLFKGTFALAKLMVELRGRLALAGNLLEFTGIYRDYFNITVFKNLDSQVTASDKW